MQKFDDKATDLEESFTQKKDLLLKMLAKTNIYSCDSESFLINNITKMIQKLLTL